MLYKLKKILKRIVKEPGEIDHRFMPNVFQKFFKRKALVSYITRPFVSGVSNAHTNDLECFTACKILDKLGYIVDVINYDFKLIGISYDDYEIIYGFGISLEDSFSFDINCKIKKIVYGTGCDTVFCNKSSFSRVKDFFRKTNILCVNSARFNELTWRKQILLSDLIISLGNDFVKKTYESQTETDVESIDIFYQDKTLINLATKNFTAAKNKFLWWGSGGAIHKGLDLLLDAFSTMDDADLYICGYSPEYPFHNYFLEKVNDNKNIHNLGFIAIDSDEYQKLLSECSAVIFPSISEGGSPGVVQLVCSGGLIPIIPQNSGINVPFPELAIEQFSAHSIISSVSKFMAYDTYRIQEMSLQLRDEMRVKHSYEKYFSRLELLIQKVLNHEKDNFVGTSKD